MPIKTIAGVDLFQEICELLQLKFFQAVVFIFVGHVSAEMDLFTKIWADEKPPPSYKDYIFTRL